MSQSTSWAFVIAIVVVAAGVAVLDASCDLGMALAAGGADAGSPDGAHSDPGHELAVVASAARPLGPEHATVATHTGPRVPRAASHRPDLRPPEG